MASTLPKTNTMFLTKLKQKDDPTLSWTDLNMLSFNFEAAPRKSLRFTRFVRSYVKRPAVVLTNHCQIYTAFLLDVHLRY